MFSVKYSETGLLCVAQGLCDHVDSGFTDKFNNCDVYEQCIDLRAKVQVWSGFWKEEHVFCSIDPVQEPSGLSVRARKVSSRTAN